MADRRQRAYWYGSIRAHEAVFTRPCSPGPIVLSHLKCMLRGTREASSNQTGRRKEFLDSFQALLVTFAALLPGGLYVWSFERQAGRYGISLSDRLLRFVGGSAVFLAIFAVPLYILWMRYSEPLAERQAVPLWLALAPLIYVLLPMAVGTLVGLGLRRGWRWSSALTAPDPAPRAWDYLFQYQVDGWVRCRMKSGTWLAGAYADANGRRSYAAGYPEQQDLYLAASVAIDSETGEFLLDEEGRPTLGAGGLLFRWEEVEYLEFIDS